MTTHGWLRHSTNLELFEVSRYSGKYFYFSNLPAYKHIIRVGPLVWAIFTTFTHLTANVLRVKASLLPPPSSSFQMKFEKVNKGEK